MHTTNFCYEQPASQTYMYFCIYTGFGMFNIFSGGSSSLKQELKKIMFPSSGDTPVHLSMDSENFCRVMSLFQNYESQVR